MITQNLNIRLANPVNAEKKYVVRTCHLKDFQICRQDSEKRWRTGRSSEVKNDKILKNLKIAKNDLNSFLIIKYNISEQISVQFSSIT